MPMNRDHASFSCSIISLSAHLNVDQFREHVNTQTILPAGSSSSVWYLTCRAYN